MSKVANDTGLSGEVEKADVDAPDQQVDFLQENLSSSQGSEAETNCQAPLLNMTDINAIIGVQPDSAGNDSDTLEGEIDALSKMIDSKDSEEAEENEQAEPASDSLTLIGESYNSEGSKSPENATSSCDKKYLDETQIESQSQTNLEVIDGVNSLADNDETNTAMSDETEDLQMDTDNMDGLPNESSENMLIPEKEDSSSNTTIPDFEEFEPTMETEEIFEDPKLPEEPNKVNSPPADTEEQVDIDLSFDPEDFDDNSPFDKDINVVEKPSAESVEAVDEVEVENGEDSPLKEEKSRSENVESPRIILKIAKSAIADCSEPRSPKSPKVIRSATNSPNPDECQRLSKIKLKMSKGGHASIITNNESSNSNKDEWHTDCSSDASGMKLKITKQHSEEKPHEELPGRVKLKRTRPGDTSLISQTVNPEVISDPDLDKKRTDSPHRMKMIFAKTGENFEIKPEIDLTKDHLDLNAYSLPKPQQQEDETPPENESILQNALKKSDSTAPKFKLVRNEDSTVIHLNKESQEMADPSKKLDPLKIKVPKMGEPSIIHSEDASSSSPTVTERVDSPCVQIIQEGPGESATLHLKRVMPVEPTTMPPAKNLEIKAKNASQKQLEVISQEIIVTQVPPIQEDQKIDSPAPAQSVESIASTPECEIIDDQPELVILNENSESSQDVMIIEDSLQKQQKEYVRIVDIIDIPKPKKRGRPRKNQNLPQSDDNGNKDDDRPKRTCRAQKKSYAPTKRGGRGGRGRGRGGHKVSEPREDVNVSNDAAAPVSILGKRKLDQSSMYDINSKRMKQDQVDLQNEFTNAIKSGVNFVDPLVQHDAKKEAAIKKSVRGGHARQIVAGNQSSTIKNDELDRQDTILIKVTDDEGKDPPNWLAPSIKTVSESLRNEAGNSNMSTLTVIDEDTRMSAESNSRSQTPARILTAQSAHDPILNEESQGSVISTATTESEKVKTRTRRTEIFVDPDDGPVSVEKIAEYEWPPFRNDRYIIRESYMIQEQISQYLGVKSFKRKYPDLKRRMVDMEERNFLRENALVSESMCDMGLTALVSSEVLDIMCTDFPEQYEEYRKYVRDKQAKERVRKQKEQSAAANAERNRMDLAEMAVMSARNWNAKLNKERRDTRSYSLDLQSFNVHVPRRQPKLDANGVGIGGGGKGTASYGNHYPVALIPGQYTDYYREYTPAELRYYPLNTVLYGPMRPNERKFDSQSEGSQSDSDSDSSSDDSSSSSSDGSQDSEVSRSGEVEMELAAQRDLKCKLCLSNLNKNNQSEILIQCGTCAGYVHPSCIDVTVDMVPHIRAYAWQCTDCKTCAQCHDPADEDKMLFCDLCDRGYHIYCVGLRRVPQGRWHCQECAVCNNCGCKDAAGFNPDKSVMNPQWHHEYKKGDKNLRVFVSTFCVPCSKLRGYQANSL